MSETAILDRSVDLSNESAEKTPKLIEGTKSKVTKFVSSLFEDKVPVTIEQRLKLLNNPNSIIIGDKAVDEELIRSRGVSNIGTESVAGFYDGNSEKIYFRDRVTEEIAIHEMLHFLSSAKDGRDFKSGITKNKLDDISRQIEAVLSISEPSKYDPTNKKPNEAITEILTLLIESNIDIHDPEAFYKLFGFIKNKQESSDLHTADSYQDYILNTLEFMYKNLDTVGIIRDLSKFYLSGDRVGFEEMLKKRSGFSNIVLSRFGNRDIVQEFYDEAKKEAFRDLESFKELVANTNDRFQKDPRFSKDLKELMNLLNNSFYNPQGIEVDIIHPENNVTAISHKNIDFIKVSPGFVYQNDQKTSPTTINIDSRFLLVTAADLNLPVDYVRPFQYLCQMEGYFIWNAIVLKQIEDQQIRWNSEEKKYLDKDGTSVNMYNLRMNPFHNPDFLNFLSSLSASEMAKVISTFRLLKFDINNEDSAALIEKIAKKSNGLNDYSAIDLREEGSEENISKELDKRGVKFHETLIVPNGYIYIPNMDLSQVEKLHS